MAKTLRSREISSVLTGSLLGLLFGLACTGVFPTKVKDILANPRQYDGKTVVIAGEVKESANLLFMKYYTVKDATGEITVITNRAVPRSGEKVRVKGVVSQAFSLGDRSLVVVVEKGDGDSG